MEPPSSPACFTWAFFRASRDGTGGPSKRPRQFGQPTHLPDQCPPSCTDAEVSEEARAPIWPLPLLFCINQSFLELSYPPQNPHVAFLTTVMSATQATGQGWYRLTYAELRPNKIAIP